MATTKIAAGAGFRRMQIFPLKTTNALPAPPAVAGADGYVGLHMVGSKAFTPTYPEPQIITHTGDDGIVAVAMIPPNETVTAELRTGATNLLVDAALQNINVVAFGDMQIMGRGVVPQTYAQVGLFMFRQAVDVDPDSSDKGADRWIWMSIPNAKASPRAGPAEEGGADENVYSVLPQVVKRYLWGFDFASATEGFVAAQVVYGISNGPPMFVTYLIDSAPLLTLNYPQTARLSEAGTDMATKVFLWASATGVVTDITATSTLTSTSEFTVVGAVEDDMIYIVFETEDIIW